MGSKSVAECLETKVLPNKGIRVKTKPNVGPSFEMTAAFTSPKYVGARSPDKVGTYLGWVPGCGGDVWWVKHDDGSTAIYMPEELVDLQPQREGDDD
jgi:hypothetical protein